jgi:hypothetical protein
MSKENGFGFNYPVPVPHKPRVTIRDPIVSARMAPVALVLVV